jgi:restriction endonuclease S subunit
MTPINPQQTLPEFIFWTLRSMYSDIRALTGDNERSGLNIPILKSLQIPLPPPEFQRQLVAEIEGYQEAIAAQREAISRYEQKIESAIARIWGESPATEPPANPKKTKDPKPLQVVA